MEPCPTGDDLSAGQLKTNTLVRKVDIPLDRCRRQPELRADLLPGGRVSVSRMFSLSAASTVYLDSRAAHAAAGFTGPCFVPSVRVDGEVVPDISARFSIKAGPHVAEVAAEVPADGRACVARMEPRMEVSQ
jgi:hypothetical protein